MSCPIDLLTSTTTPSTPPYHTHSAYTHTHTHTHMTLSLCLSHAHTHTHTPRASHYTVVTAPRPEGGKEGEDGGDGAAPEYTATPFGTFFAESLAPVLEGFDTMIANLRAVAPIAGKEEDAADGEGKDGGGGGLQSNAQRAAYVAYLSHYRVCLASTESAEKLEEMWTELDTLWMDTRGDIQIVHDIETGYGDPLRVKATPDFSLRFLDSSTFEKENNQVRRKEAATLIYTLPIDT